MPIQEFRKKSISSQTSIGERLKATRKKKKISLEKAEQDIKIRLHYLEAIENNQTNIIPLSHRKGFIRRYADYLGVATTSYDTENPESDSKEFLKGALFSPTRLYKETRWVITPKVVIFSIASLLLVAFVGYVIYQIQQFAAPPALTITQPQNESVATNETVVIEGDTEPGATLFIDNYQITSDSSGHFSYSVVLRPGLNQVTVRTINAIKKESTKTLSILYQAPSPTRSPSPSPSPSP